MLAIELTVDDEWSKSFRVDGKFDKPIAPTLEVFEFASLKGLRIDGTAISDR